MAERNQICVSPHSSVSRFDIIGAIQSSMDHYYAAELARQMRARGPPDLARSTTIMTNTRYSQLPSYGDVHLNNSHWVGRCTRPPDFRRLCRKSSRNMIPALHIPPPRKCLRCKLPVYIVEREWSVSEPFHKTCFRCMICNSSIARKNMIIHNGKPYCDHPCYNELFGLRAQSRRITSYIPPMESTAPIMESVIEELKEHQKEAARNAARSNEYRADYYNMYSRYRNGTESVISSTGYSTVTENAMMSSTFGYSDTPEPNLPSDGYSKSPYRLSGSRIRMHAIRPGPCPLRDHPHLSTCHPDFCAYHCTLAQEPKVIYVQCPHRASSTDYSSYSGYDDYEESESSYTSFSDSESEEYGTEGFNDESLTSKSNSSDSFESVSDSHDSETGYAEYEASYGVKRYPISEDSGLQVLVRPVNFSRARRQVRTHHKMPHKSYSISSSLSDENAPSSARSLQRHLRRCKRRYSENMNNLKSKKSKPVQYVRPFSRTSVTKSGNSQPQKPLVQKTVVQQSSSALRANKTKRVVVPVPEQNSYDMRADNNFPKGEIVRNNERTVYYKNCTAIRRGNMVKRLNMPKRDDVSDPTRNTATNEILNQEESSTINQEPTDLIGTHASESIESEDDISKMPEASIVKQNDTSFAPNSGQFLSDKKNVHSVFTLQKAVSSKVRDIRRGVRSPLFLQATRNSTFLTGEMTKHAQINQSPGNISTMQTNKSNKDSYTLNTICCKISDENRTPSSNQDCSVETASAATQTLIRNSNKEDPSNQIGFKFNTTTNMLQKKQNMNQRKRTPTAPFKLSSEKSTEASTGPLFQISEPSKYTKSNDSPLNMRFFATFKENDQSVGTTCDNIERRITPNNIVSLGLQPYDKELSQVVHRKRMIPETLKSKDKISRSQTEKDAKEQVTTGSLDNQTKYNSVDCSSQKDPEASSSCIKSGCTVSPSQQTLLLDQVKCSENSKLEGNKGMSLCHEQTNEAVTTEKQVITDSFVSQAKYKPITARPSQQYQKETESNVRPLGNPFQTIKQSNQAYCSQVSREHNNKESLDCTQQYNGEAIFNQAVELNQYSTESSRTKATPHGTESNDSRGEYRNLGEL